MDPRLLYESPFTDIDPLGVAGVFAEGEVIELVQILRDVQGWAAGVMLVLLPFRAPHGCSLLYPKMAPTVI